MCSVVVITFQPTTVSQETGEDWYAYMPAKNSTPVIDGVVVTLANTSHLEDVFTICSLDKEPVFLFFPFVLTNRIITSNS